MGAAPGILTFLDTHGLWDLWQECIQDEGSVFRGCPDSGADRGSHVETQRAGSVERFRETAMRPSKVGLGSEGQRASEIRCPAIPVLSRMYDGKIPVESTVLCSSQ